MIALTTDIHAVLEGFRNLWVHIDEKVLLLCKLLIAIFNLVLDPAGKG